VACSALNLVVVDYMIEVKRSGTTGPYEILIGNESFFRDNVNALVTEEGRKVSIKDRELSRKEVSKRISEISKTNRDDGSRSKLASFARFTTQNSFQFVS
jgi:hypothetical protein